MEHNLSKKSIEIIKETASLITINDELIAKRMYEIMFQKHPSFEKLFENANIGQHKKLAEALSAYAINIENLKILKPALERIAEIHVKRGVKAEFYPMVGLCLIQAIEDVLGTDASIEFIDAWRDAYLHISKILINIEKNL